MKPFGQFPFGFVVAQSPLWLMGWVCGTWDGSVAHGMGSVAHGTGSVARGVGSVAHGVGLWLMGLGLWLMG